MNINFIKYLYDLSIIIMIWYYHYENDWVSTQGCNFYSHDSDHYDY